MMGRVVHLHPLAPYFDEWQYQNPAPVADITKARVLAVFGDSVTHDHISPAGSIKKTARRENI